MKIHEVGIIIAVILILGYFWYMGQQSSTKVSNPTNATSPGYRVGP